MNQNLQARSSLPELKRFLDRLLSSPEGADTSPRLQQEHHDTAVALGVVAGERVEPAEPSAAQAVLQPLPMAELIERTRACIRLQEPVRAANQSLETMSAPPAMPEATP